MTKPSVDATFLTITLSGPTDRNFEPGNYDPEIPKHLVSELDTGRSTGSEGDVHEYRILGMLKELWSRKASTLVRGGTVPWW